MSRTMCQHIYSNGVVKGQQCRRYATIGNHYCECHDQHLSDECIWFNDFLIQDCGIEPSEVPTGLYENCECAVNNYFTCRNNDKLGKLKDEIAYYLFGKRWTSVTSVDLIPYSL